MLAQSRAPAQQHSQVLGSRVGGHHPESARFSGTSPRYMSRGAGYRRRQAQVSPQADAITLVSKERLELEEHPGTINWVVLLMVVAISVFLAFVVGNVFWGIVVTLSMVPPLILTYGLYWWRDRAKVAPVLYFGTFWGGVMAAIIFSLTVGLLTAWLISLLSMGAGLGYKLGQAALATIILTGFMEEVVKYLVLYAVKDRAKLSHDQAVVHQKIIRERIQLSPLTERESQEAAETYPGPRQIRHPYGMVILGMVAGMGFAFIENIVFTYTIGRSLGWVISIFRSALSVPFHAMLGGLIGERMARNEWFGEDHGILSCIWLPVVLHICFDFILVFLGVFAMEYSRDEVAYTAGALVGAFLVFLATIGVLIYRVKNLYDDADSLPAIEYRPPSMLPSELREQTDVDVEDPDRQRQAAKGAEYRSSTDSGPSATKSAVIQAEERERKRRMEEEAQRAAQGLPPKTGFVPTAVSPEDGKASSIGASSSMLPSSGSGNQDWISQGIQSQQSQMERQQQLRQLEMAEENRRRQILNQQQYPGPMHASP